MKIMVSGTSGFIGGAFIENLQKIGNVEIRKVRNNPNMTEPGDIARNDGQIVVPAVSQDYVNQTQTLIHLGNFTPKNKESLNNIGECSNSLEISRQLFFDTFPNLQKIIFASTIDVYEPNLGLIDEHSKVSIRNSYIASKIFSEQFALKAALNKKIDLDIFRIGHVYGQGDSHFQKFLPNLVRSFNSDLKFKLTTSLKQKLDLIYISDVVSVITEAALIPQGRGITNLVSSNNITVNELINFFEIKLGKKIDLEIINSEHVVTNSKFNNAKLCRDFNFVETPINVGLSNYFE